MVPRQKMAMPCAFPAYVTRLEVNENNLVEEKTYDLASVVLPDVETTDLETLIDAGVDVKRVNTKILNGNTVVTDLSEEIKQEGVNDEN